MYISENNLNFETSSCKHIRKRINFENIQKEQNHFFNSRLEYHLNLSRALTSLAHDEDFVPKMNMARE